tara:strand:- start:610 stop:1350 length:741 start_codon:yes stop_codon:yes gene_type:complete
VSDTVYSARWAGPTFIERDKDQQIEVAIERSGAAVTVTSGTLTVYKPSGEAIVDAVAGTVAGGTFTSATIAAAITSGEDFAKRWLVKVDLVISGATFTFYNDAVLCRARLYPTIGQTDLVARHSEAANLLGSSITSLQGYIDQAWTDITERLYLEGVPFWRWRTPSALRQVLFDRSFELLFYDYATLLGNNDRYFRFAERYSEQYERDLERLRSTIDNNEDNQLSEEIVTGSPVLLLSSSRRRLPG